MRELLDGLFTKDETLLKYPLCLKKTLREWIAAHRVTEAAAPGPLATGFPETGPHTLELPTAELAAGLYTVRLLHQVKVEYRKLVVGQ